MYVPSGAHNQKAQKMIMTAQTTHTQHPIHEYKQPYLLDEQSKTVYE